MLRTTATFPALLLLASAMVSHADLQDGQALLEQGVAAFQRGDAQEARSHLLQARAAGLDSTALTYNLGVVNFQLGDYAAATEAFQALLSTPHRDLACYNLGLVALATDRPEDARQRFLALSTGAESDKIRALAERQLARLSPDDAPPAAHGMAGLIMAGGGYDSNVDQLPDSAASGAGEAYADALLSLSGDIGRADEQHGGYFWKGFGYHQRFPGDQASNLSLLEGGLGWRPPLASVDMENTLFTRHWWLDTERVESYYGIRSLLVKQGCGGLDRCHLQVELAGVQGGPDYAEYDGWQYDLEAGARQRLWGGVLAVEVFLGLADRDDIREPDYAASVSPFRQQLELSWRTALGDRLSLTGRTAFRRSDYQGDYRWTSLDGPQSRQRQDRRWSAALLADWQLNADWFASTELRYESNSSSLSGYDYDRYNLWLGVGKTF